MTRNARFVNHVSVSGKKARNRCFGWGSPLTALDAAVVATKATGGKTRKRIAVARETYRSIQKEAGMSNNGGNQFDYYFFWGRIIAAIAPAC
jgi:hypothetical protein